jgi:hypothetical protein
MAVSNQLRAMCARISFTGADDNFVDIQGTDSVRELGHLNDNDDVSNLCETIPCPGGHHPNPACALVGGAEALVIPHTGIRVSQPAETSMQLASHTVRHHNRISRTVNVQGVNLTLVRTRLRDSKLK